ncbi:Uncharacterized protein APZ42_031722 [Daphnia magna]|uniref:Uncharacterized protein n=1 Tax=Daphnia magna TaxID=35525 RepID=A0A164ML48_9CRUS|nr:Uncharacterized protein APZ42_031722 [Daphnia magna]
MKIIHRKRGRQGRNCYQCETCCNGACFWCFLNGFISIYSNVCYTSSCQLLIKIKSPSGRFGVFLFVLNTFK